MEKPPPSEYQLPLVLTRTNEVYSPLSVEESTAIVLYYAEDNRKRPGFFRKTGERIILVSPLNYVLWVLDIDGRNSLILDPNREGALKLEYYKPNIDILNEKISELKAKEYKDYIPALTEIKQVLEGMIKRKRNVVLKSFKLEHVVSDKTLLEELKILVIHSIQNILEALRIEERKLDVEGMKDKIREILELIYTTRKRLTDILKSLRPIHEKWLEDVRTTYAERIHGVEQELEVVRKKVEEKINELKAKQAEEIEAVRHRFGGQIGELERRIEELRKKIEELKIKYDKAREYGQDTKLLKKRINDAEKKLSSLEKEREELLNKMNTEIESIKARYMEYITNEKLRVDRLRKEIEKLNNELETLEKQAGDRLDEIRGMINKLIDDVSLFERSIMSVMIGTPPHGEGRYYLPVVIISYRSKDKSRHEVFTPAYIATGSLTRSPKLSFFTEIRNYLSDIAGLMNDTRYAGEIERHNILKRADPSRILSTLDRLAEQELVNRKKLGKMAEKLAEQIRMVQS